MLHKKIVNVFASFEDSEELFTTLKKYAQYFDEDYAYWDEFAFTVKEAITADGCLIYNAPRTTKKVYCFPEWLVAFMMEPGLKGEHPWMFKNLDQYHQVYSPVKASGNTILSHGFLGWYFRHNWKYLSELRPGPKSFPLSCIASNLSVFCGHRIRSRFVNLLKQAMPEAHFFGKGIQFLPDKMDGLLPYRFSIAIENSSSDDYFTEKINDCFLAYTVPFYYGAKRIDKYFPPESYIWIDIHKPESAIETIRESITETNWSRRLEAVKEARERVLNQYQPLAGAAAIFRNITIKQPRKDNILHPTRDEIGRLRFSLLSKLKIN